MAEDNQLEEFKKEIQKEELVPLGWKIIKSDKILKIELPEAEFLVGKLIPSAGITILSGNPGCGKSWLLLEIARCIGSTNPLFAQNPLTPDSFNRFRTKEARVLYIDEESSLTETNRRWKMLEPPSMTLVDFMPLQGFKIDNSEQRRALLNLCDHRSYRLIIFDSLRDIHSFNENDSRETQWLVDYFREFTRKGITVLISHHNRKESFLNPRDPSQILRGSTALLAGLDCLLSVENAKSTNELIELIISQPKLRQGKPTAPFKVNLIEQDGKMKIEYAGEVEEETTKIQKTKEAIVEFLKNGEKYLAEITQALIPLYFSERTIKRAISELKDEKSVKPRKEGQRIYYSLVP